MHLFSNQFKNELDNDHRKFLIRMDVATTSGQNFTITNADIWSGTFNIEDCTSASGAFTVGGLIASKLTFSLNNADERFSAYNLIDSVISLQVGMELTDGTIEMIQYGVYNISESSFTASAINIVALDNLSRLSHPCKEVFPAHMYAYSVIIRCCQACRIDYDPDTMPAFLRSYRLPNAIAGDYSYASIVSYAAQIAGCFVKADAQGRLRFDWYEMSALKNTLDGGTFAYDGKGEDGEPEAELDGGRFDKGTPSYTTGDEADGGTFRALEGYYVVNAQTQNEIDTDDVRITGVRVVVPSEQDGMPDDITLMGSEGYVIEIRENPFVGYKGTLVVAQNVWSAIGNMVFRPLSATILPDPIVEAGDVGYVSDVNGNYYACFFSTVKFSPDGTGLVACDAVSSNQKNRAVQSTAQLAVTTAVQQSKKWVAVARKETQDFIQLMSQAMGFYSTEVAQDDGSTIKYLHNKPNLESSDVQWKITVDGIAVSTDYGQTWNAGISKEGNMMVQVLSAVGVNADWINAGTISGIHINGSYISGGTITGTKLQGGEIDIGYGTSSSFKVDKDGKVIASNLNMTGGNIALNDAAGQGAFTISGNSGTYVSLGSTYVTISGPSGAAILTPGGLVVTGANGSSSFSNGVINLNGKRVLTQDDYSSLMQAMSDADTAMSGKILSMSKTIADHERRIQVLEGQLRGFIDTTFASLEKRVAALEKKIK